MINSEERRRGPSRRSPSWQNYRRVERAKRDIVEEGEIRVTSAGPINRYATLAERQITEGRNNMVILKATGIAVTVAILTAEVLKRRIRGIHQLNEISWTEVVDEYESKVQGLPNRTVIRSLPSLSIVLTTDLSKIDSSAPGYQPPLDEEAFVEATADVAALLEGNRKELTPTRSKRRNATKKAENFVNNNSPPPQKPRVSRRKNLINKAPNNTILAV